MQIRLLKPMLPHRRRKPGVVVDTIVLHATAGSTVQSAVDTLRERGLSYHHLIAKNGQIVKCAPALAVAFHAGQSLGPQGPAVNEYSVGISFVNLNDGVDPYTAAQEASVRALLSSLIVAMPSLRILTTHRAIAPRRKSDPLNYDVRALAADLGLQLFGGN
jgi:N-acetylmuramoyl-L-alanine amidase